MSGCAFLPSGRYRMAIHGWPDRGGYRLDRSNRRHQRRPVYSVTHPDEFDLERFADRENLLDVYRVLRSQGGPAPGIDGMGYDVSMGEAAEMTRALSRAIRSRTYVPHETRGVRIPKGDGRYRELRLGVIGDRVVGKALLLAMEPYYRVAIPALWQDPWLILARIEREVTDQGRHVLVIDDIRDAFPSTSIQDVLEDHRRITTSPDLLWLTTTVIQGHEGERRIHGLDQGCAYSPAAFCMRMQNVLGGLTGANQDTDRHQYPDDTIGSDGYTHDPDQTREAEGEHPRTAGPDRNNSPRLHRYADNLAWTCGSVTEGHQILEQARHLLRPAGYAPKGTDGGVVDLRTGDTVPSMLGYRISLDTGGLLRYELGDHAWESLEQSLLDAHRTHHPARAAVDAALGWLGATGPALETVGQGEVVDRVRRLAVRIGHREIGGRDVLLDAVRRSQDRWDQIREQVRQVDTDTHHPDHLHRIRQIRWVEGASRPARQ